jgi:hypothetical protein
MEGLVTREAQDLQKQLRYARVSRIGVRQI